LTHSDHTNYPCTQYDIPVEGRGVTIWDQNTNGPVLNTILPNTHKDFSFTCTLPKCYAYYLDGHEEYYGKDSCNFHFTAYAADSNNASAGIDLNFKLNGEGVDGSHLTGGGGTQNHLTQTFELASTYIDNHIQSGLYNDTAINTFSVYNNSSSTIIISDVGVYRAYKMCNLTADHTCMCPHYWNGKTICHEGTTPGTLGFLDSYRTDKPCNYESCGGLTYSSLWMDDHANGTLDAYSTFTWVFNMADYAYCNYPSDVACLFNFNKMKPDSTSIASYPLHVVLNGNTIDTFYLSRAGGTSLEAFPSYDIAKNTAYVTNGYNTVQLVNSGNIPIIMSNDGINIYRFSNSGSICPYSDYSDHSDNPHGNWIGSHSDFSDYTDGPFSDTPHTDGHTDDPGQFTDFTDCVNYDDWAHGDIPSTHDDEPAVFTDGHNDNPAYSDTPNGWSPYSDYTDQA
jgi:hypothetical protein